MTSEPQSMQEVAALMRQSLPAGVTPSEFGERIQWGRGSQDAIRRIQTLTVDELIQLGLTNEAASQWAIAYEAVVRFMPSNPSAAGRAALMRHAANLLSGE